jgi:hypothetical protein
VLLRVKVDLRSNVSDFERVVFPARVRFTSRFLCLIGRVGLWL